MPYRKKYPKSLAFTSRSCFLTLFGHTGIVPLRSQTRFFSRSINHPGPLDRAEHEVCAQPAFQVNYNETRIESWIFKNTSKSTLNQVYLQLQMRTVKRIFAWIVGCWIQNCLWFLLAHVRIVRKYCCKLDYKKSNKILACIRLSRWLLLFYASR